MISTMINSSLTVTIGSFRITNTIHIGLFKFLNDNRGVEFEGELAAISNRLNGHIEGFSLQITQPDQGFSFLVDRTALSLNTFQL